MKLKVAVVTPVFPIPARPFDGLSTYQLVHALTKRAEVEVFCPMPRYPKWFQPSFDHCRPDLSYSPDGVVARYFEYLSLPGITRCINGLVCARYLKPYIREFRPHVVLNFWLYPAGYAAVEVARELGIPAVVGSIGSDLNSIPDPASRMLTRLAMERAAFVMVKSTGLRQRAIQMGIDPKKVRVVMNGCDSSVFRLASRNAARQQLDLDENAELILFVGRLVLAKGIVELLDAFASVASRRPKLRLTYIGEGPDDKVLQRKAKEAQLESRIHLMSGCPSQGVAQWLAAANVLALPSYAEGCPNVVIEALSCGRPVIATNVGGIPELVNDECSILVDPKDSGALANAIDRAMKQNWDERSISEHFRRTWDQSAGEIFNICEQAVQQHQYARQLLTRPSAVTG